MFPKLPLFFNRRMPAKAADPVRLAGKFTVTCRRPDGTVRWQQELRNLIVNAGLDYALDVALGGGTQIAAWYLGLKAAGAPAAADTMASHASWTEITAYSEAVRQTWTPGAVSGQSISNPTAASFSINATTTIAGIFLTSDSAKGGATGTLWAATDFAAARNGENGDTLEVTYTANAAAA